MQFTVRVVLVAVLVSALFPRPVEAHSLHLIQIEQVIGGVEGDRTAQAIQLRLRFPGETLLQFSRLRVYDATGQNPIILIDFDTAVPNGALGARILIASDNFAAYMSSDFVSDFTMTELIPESYLSAGRITYEGDEGTIYWSLAYGGDAYTGSTIGASINDVDGEFGPPFDGPLPTDTIQSLVFTGSATDSSVTNQDDYTVSFGAGLFTNNNGDFFLITLPPVTPTVSEWGLAAFALLLLTAGTIVQARSRAVT